MRLSEDFSYQYLSISPSRGESFGQNIKLKVKSLTMIRRFQGE